MPATPIHIGLTNHVMGSRPGSPYFTLLLTRLQAYNRNWLFPYMTIMNSAGPHFVSMVWEEFLRGQRQQRGKGENQVQGHEREEREVRILMQEEYAGNSWSFFEKGRGGTWNGWDTRVFRWFSTRIVLFVVLCVLVMGMLTAAGWWVVWWVGRAVRSNSGKGGDVLPVWRKSD
jgi:inositol phosphorylceramide mannosyltransferase catalytic subunit